jgi:hypothetical protein
MIIFKKVTGYYRENFTFNFLKFKFCDVSLSWVASSITTQPTKSPQSVRLIPNPEANCNSILSIGIAYCEPRRSIPHSM